MSWTHNSQLNAWVENAVALCTPDEVHFCDGSQDEYDFLAQKLVKSGSFVKLDDSLRPNSYLCRSHPHDVSRVEGRTSICSPR